MLTLQHLTGIDVQTISRNRHGSYMKIGHFVQVAEALGHELKLVPIPTDRLRGLTD